MNSKLVISAAALAFGLTGLAAPALGGVADEVKATIANAQNAYNSCDVAGMQGMTHANFFALNPDGTLTEGNSMAEMKKACDAGTKYNFNIDVTKVYEGNGWAVAVGTNKGTVKPKEGDEQKVDTHFTVVMVKDGDAWKSMHLHVSPNMKPPAE